MNYLAHLTYCPQDDDILAGVFLGDSIKGNAWQNLPSLLGKGVIIHRKMDYYTDHYQGFGPLNALLSEELGIWKGVAVDMYIDHILARNWSDLHTASLKEHTEELFARLHPYQHHFPEKSHLLYQAMSRSNWLLGYAEAEKLEWAFQGMSRRSNYENPLLLAPGLLKIHYTLIEETCLTFLNSLESLDWSLD